MIQKTSLLNKKQQNFFILATPIGTITDISLATIAALKNSKILICENKIFIKKLCAYHQINISQKTLLVYNKHFEEKTNFFINRYQNILNSEENIYLVVSQGTPCICDPGYKIVKYFIKKQAKIYCLGVNSAFLYALCISGVNVNNGFYFHGFFSNKNTSFPVLDNTAIIYYVNSKNMSKSYLQIKKLYKSGNFMIFRELSKTHQSIYTCNLESFLEILSEVLLKGQFTIMFIGKSYLEEKKIINMYTLLKQTNLENKQILTILKNHFMTTTKQLKILLKINFMSTS